MNYLGLISICLGLLSLIIALKFLNVLKNIDKKLSLDKECRVLKHIKSESGLNIQQIKNKLNSNKESFRNYKHISNTNTADKKYTKFSNDIPNILQNSKKILEKSFPEIFSNKKCTDNRSLNNFNSYNKLSNKYCMVQQGNKKYCFKTPFMELCPGKIVNNTNNCQTT
mgnify:CR=1 FL=1